MKVKVNIDEKIDEIFIEKTHFLRTMLLHTLYQN